MVRPIIGSQLNHKMIWSVFRDSQHTGLGGEEGQRAPENLVILSGGRGKVLLGEGMAGLQWVRMDQPGSNIEKGLGATGMETCRPVAAGRWVGVRVRVELGGVEGQEQGLEQWAAVRTLSCGIFTW